MYFFKHSHDLRNSPAMKQIQRKLGDSGFAAAIRLIEVMTYRSGTGKKFNPVLKLAAPTSEHWLAREILSYDDSEVDEGLIPVNMLSEYLNEFGAAGLIICNHVAGETAVNDDGKWKYVPCKHLTIQLVEFEELMDTWTKRAREGREGRNSTKA